MTTILTNYRKSAILNIAICATILFGLFAQQVHAQDEPSPTQTAIKTFIGNMLKYNGALKLTDDQKTKAVAVLQNHKAEIQAEMKKAKEARQAFNKVAKVDLTSQATLDAADKIGESAASGAILRAKITAEMKTILDEDQQTTILNAGKEVENLIAKLFSSVEE